jgi:hypothetical protein
MPDVPPTSSGVHASLDGGDLSENGDPPPLAGNLAAEIEAFTTVDACVMRRAQLDPLIGDALDAIGYDTLLRDACRMLDAAKARDAKRCAAIDASSLRERCQSAVAEIGGAADGCPWRVDSKRAMGRDPACVALAARDERLCAGIRQPLGRVTCGAIAGHAPARCGALARPGERARCEREVARWESVIPPPSGDHRQGLASTGKLTVTLGDAGAPVVTDLQAEVNEGVVLVVGRMGTRLTLGPSSDFGVGRFPASPTAETALTLELLLPATGTKLARFASDAGRAGGGGAPPNHETGTEPQVESFVLRLPGRSELRAPPTPAKLGLTVAKLEPLRAGALELSFDGDLANAEGAVHVHAEVVTFVRDVVTAEALYEVNARPFGSGQEMR